MILDSSKVTFLISQTIQSYVHRNSLVRFLGQLCTYSPRPCSTSFSIASELGTMAQHIHSEYANFIESILKLVHLIVNWMLLHSSPYIYTMGSKCFIEFHEILWKTFISRKHLLFFWVYNSVSERQIFHSPDHEKVEFDQFNVVFCFFCYLESMKKF